MREKGVLWGFSGAAWTVVVCNALNGLAISAVLKYADNIARVYAHAIAMMCAAAAVWPRRHARHRLRHRLRHLGGRPLLRRALRPSWHRPVIIRKG